MRPFNSLATVVLGLVCQHFSGTSAFIFPRGADNETIVPVAVRNFGDQAYTVHVAMGTLQWFNFTLSTTHAYTAVAGLSCTQCSTTATGRYNSTKSPTYVAPAAANSSLSVQYNGLNIVGGLATENCGFKEGIVSNKTTWWWYNQQRIVVAGQDSSSNVFGPSVGLAGLGVSGVTDSSDSIIGHILNNATDPLSQFVFGIALYSYTTGATSSGTQLSGDTSGGFLHINGPDPSFYTGTLDTQVVVGSSTLNQFGSVPTQLGSYDWTLQIQGWLFKNRTAQVTGGQGMYATVETGYPYILLPQQQANSIYAMIPGAQAYIVAADATLSSGQAVYQDSLALAYSIPCGAIQTSSLYINFQGVSIPLQPQDMWTSINGVCVGNVRGWADPTRATAILGSPFFRNAYVVFTAAQDPTQNMVGIANRLLSSQKKDSANKGVIIGATVGGVCFLIAVATAVFFLIRGYKQRPRTPPSALFTGQAPTLAHRSGTDEGSRTRSSLFRFGSSKNGHRKDSDLVVEPWLPPADGIRVQSWTPSATSEMAFLAPTGLVSPGLYQTPTTPSTSTHHTRPMSTGSGYTNYVTPPPTYGGHQQVPGANTYFPLSQQTMSPTSPIAPQSTTSTHFHHPPGSATAQSTTSTFPQQAPHGASAPISPALHSPVGSVGSGVRMLPNPPGRQTSF